MRRIAEWIDDRQPLSGALLIIGAAVIALALPAHCQTWVSPAALHWDAPAAHHWDAVAAHVWLPPAQLSWVITASPSGHNVVLTWQASPTSGVSYAVYRASSASGPWTEIGTTAALTWTDVSPPAGTWLYAVTAVAAQGGESAIQDSMVSVVVP